MFTYEDGRPLSPAHISRVFDTIVARAGLQRMSLHGLRHEHASVLLQGGVPILIVSKRLGHSSAGITSDLYSHLLPQANMDAAEAFERVMDRTRTAHRAV